MKLNKFWRLIERLLPFPKTKQKNLGQIDASMLQFINPIYS